MRYRTLFAICLMLVVSSAVRAAQVELAGPWGLLLDRQNRGEANQWQTPAFWNSGKEPATVRLPGSIQSQHIGDLPTADSPWTARIGMNLLKSPKYAPFQQAGGFKTPFWLTPDRVYVGSAWYQRDMEIPASFIGQRITLVLERPHWETTVWVDGKQVGVPQNSLATPHVYDLTEVLGEQAAGTHTLVIRVDNRIKVPVGLDASSVTDQTQTNWNGIVGDVKLVSTPKTWIEDVQAYPEVATGKVRLRVNVRTLNGAPGPGNEISMAGRLRNAPNARMAALVGGTIEWKRQENTFVGEATFDLGPEPQLWSEFSPALYDVTVTIQSDEKKDLDSRAVTFGLREIGTKGTQFVLNGKPLFLRGTLECAIFPLTGYPPAGDPP